MGLSRFGEYKGTPPFFAAQEHEQGRRIRLPLQGWDTPLIALYLPNVVGLFLPVVLIGDSGVGKSKELDGEEKYVLTPLFR
jgi:hypothetical protein